MAEATPEEGSRFTVLRAPDTITVGLGAALPMFVIYEFPGPLANVTLGWDIHAHAQVVASAGAGALHLDGSRRYHGKLGAGVRGFPWRRGPLWGQLGFGLNGYVERTGIVLPERRVSATDLGAQLTADAAVGVAVCGWEVAVGFDFILVPTRYYTSYTGDESLPNRGMAVAWIGRQL
ncbi:MAG: hypothetical protein KF773_27070 [Deltaproteobacteria bacterium]|nr:hypothetical protein [Deltaproteobacteria bacterium]MCW5802531.1 hypothetical protein [Deltaproteobacteria bacterium]